LEGRQIHLAGVHEGSTVRITVGKQLTTGGQAVLYQYVFQDLMELFGPLETFLKILWSRLKSVAFSERFRQ
jgi:hypothetical protein